jgi:hypothetical protein
MENYQMANIKKNAQGYGYKYTDLAAINDYIESIGETYYQEIERIESDDYVITVRQKVKNVAIPDIRELRVRGCRVVQASLSGKVNPAQEQGSGLTYARRYSLLMAYGLATEDDDAESLTIKETRKANTDTTTDGGDQEILARAKSAINTQLEGLGYILPEKKIAFIKNVIGKETIDNLDDADSIGDAIDNEALEI